MGVYIPNRPFCVASPLDKSKMENKISKEDFPMIKSEEIMNYQTKDEIIREFRI